MKKSFILTLLLAIFVLGGCSDRLIDFTIISSKNFDISKASQYQKGTERVNGEDKLFFLLGVPLGSSINMKEAVDQAIEGVPGCVALADGVIYRKWWNLGIAAQVGFLAEGTPVIDKSIAAKLESNYIYAEYDNDSESFNYLYLTKAEYLEKKSEMIN